MRIPFNIGTDICHIPRIYRLLTENGPRGGKRFIEKVLNEQEMEAERGKVAQLREKPNELAIWVAGRWAAKEATIKAHPHRVLSRHDITIIRAPPREGRSQAPVVFVCSAQAGAEAAGHGGRNVGMGTEVKVSISHDGEYATAVCLATAEDG